jgi:hypothetical protein
MMAVANNVPTWVFYQDSFDLVEWGIKIASTPGAPLIHSVSTYRRLAADVTRELIYLASLALVCVVCDPSGYGSGESSYEADTKSRVNVEFQKLGLLGFSLLAVWSRSHVIVALIIISATYKGVPDTVLLLPSVFW